MVMDEHSKIMMGNKQYMKDDDYQLISKTDRGFLWILDSSMFKLIFANPVTFHYDSYNQKWSENEKSDQERWGEKELARQTPPLHRMSFGAGDNHTVGLLLCDSYKKTVDKSDSVPGNKFFLTKSEENSAFKK